MLFDISLSGICSDMSPQAWETKAKINEWDYIKLKSFCAVKETINKTKRKLTEWEKTFANHIANNLLLSKMFEELIQLNKNKNNLIRNRRKI